MSDLYDKIMESVEFRKIWADKCSFDIELYSVVYPIVEKSRSERLLKSFLNVKRKNDQGRGFEPPTAWPRTSFRRLLRSDEIA